MKDLRMNKTIRTIASVIPILLLLSACSAPTPSLPPQTQAPSSTPQPANVGVKAALYFPDKDKTRFITEIRTVPVGSGQTRSEAVLGELLKAPGGDLLPILPEGTRAERTEVSLTTVNVYLSGNFSTLTPDDYALARTAIANTLTDLEKAEYVNVYFNGTDPGYGGIPCGPASRDDAEISKILAGYAGMKQSIEANKNYASNAVIYFADARGKYLMPQAVPVSWSAQGNVERIVEALKAGPRGVTDLRAVLPADIGMLEAPAFIPRDDGTKTAVLNFSGLPVAAEMQGTPSGILPYAALAYSITGNIPMTSGVIIKISGTPVYEAYGLQFGMDGTLTRGLFSDLMGNHITLYFPSKDFSGLLPVQRSVSQQTAMSASTRILELMRGPLENENANAWPVFPGGTGSDELIGVQILGDTAAINLSLGFKEKCLSLDPSGESALVFAIVNSLTEIKGVKRVQFLFDGNPYQTLSGTISVVTPLIRNPGVIIPGG
jgi:spore germination protein GerM